MVNFGPLAAEIVALVWGTPANFNAFRVLAALLHSQTPALNRGRHLYSAGRPSRWALAHISSYHLFYHSCLQAHCLNHLYTVKLRPSGAMWLRTCGHDSELSSIKREFNKRNIVVRSLFKYVWFYVLSCIIFILYFVLYFIVHMCEWHMYYIPAYLLT